MINQLIKIIRTAIHNFCWQLSDLPFKGSVHIAANSQGQLTPEQIQTLIKEKASHIRVIGYGWLIFSLIYIFIVCLVNLALYNRFNFTLFFLRIFVLVLLPAGIGCILIGLGFARRKHFRDDLAMGQIELSVKELQGEITWDRRRYRASLSNGLAFSLPHHLPGPYTFYFVEEEAKIVSLIPLHTPKQRRQAFQTTQMLLCAVLGFSLSDLDANRKGLLSEKQRRKKRWRFRKRPLTVQFLEGEIFGRTRDIRISVGFNSFAYLTIYYYVIQENEFSVSSSTALEVLVHQMRYRVYYLAGTRELLSVEALDVLESPSGLTDTANAAIHAKDDEK